MQKELVIKSLDNPKQESLLLSVDPNPRVRYLSLSHPTNSKIVYYLNFTGGHLILGLNDKKILTSLELNIEKKHWAIVSLPNPRLPSPTNKLLQFPMIKTRANVNELPINVYTDEVNSFVIITINNADWINSNVIPISKQCYCVGASGNDLQGFWIIL